MTGPISTEVEALSERLRTLLRYTLLFGWMAVIYTASATPDLRAVPLAQRLGFLPRLLAPGAIDLLELILRKGAHMVTYGILALLARSAMVASFPRESKGRLASFALGVAVLYAVSDEWHQSFVPTRHGSPVDVLIDSVGAGGALLLAQMCFRRRGER